jgi:hypothetical protein
MLSEKQALILQRIEETRLYLEGPDEPAAAWRDDAAYLARVAQEAYKHLDTPPEALVVTHWRHPSAWLRRFAPTAVVESVAGKLALKTADV